MWRAIGMYFADLHGRLEEQPRRCRGDKLGTMLKRAILTGLVVLSATACGDPAGDCGGNCLFEAEPKIVSLDTVLSANETAAGAPVNARCIIKYENGSTKTLLDGFSVAVSPSESAAIEGGRITISKVGSYAVTCSAEGAPAGDTETLVVIAGVPARAVATVSPPTIGAGESAVGGCVVTDANGNEITGIPFELESDPVHGVTITGTSIQGAVAGSYAISCSLSLQDIEEVPATLTVVPGAPASVEVVLGAQQVEVGTHVSVTCRVRDENGNEVDTPTAWSATPQPSTIDATGLVATVPGSYQVTCTVPSAGLMSGPATLIVTPGLPAQIEILEVVPAKAVYARYEVVGLVVRITDAFGNEITSAAWEILGNPPGSARFAGTGQVELDGEGMIELIARVTSMTAGGAEVTDSVTLLVDGSPPEVVIDFPARAEIVAGPAGDRVTVTGHATDAITRVASLEILGQQVSLGPNGEFSTQIGTRWGVNLLEGAAVDEAGNRREFSQSFEYAESYRQAGAGHISSARIDDGLLVSVGQVVLDDNNGDVDDLATIARLAIENADIVSLIPNPATTYNSDCSVLFVTIRGALNLHVDDVRFSRPIFDITAIPGGLHLRAEIPNLAVDMHTSGDVCDIGIGISGTASVNRAVIEGDIFVSTNAGGGFSVSMPTATVQLNGLSIDLDLPGIIDWAVDGIINLFSGAIASRLESALRTTIRNEVPPVVRDFLDSISIATAIPLPSPINITLDVNTRLGSANFLFGGGNIGLDATIYTTGAMSPEPLGGILQDSFTRITPGSGARPFGVGLSYDLINQALYSIWYGGALSLDLAQFIPGDFNSNGNMAHVEAVASALLPPVLGPSSDPQYPVELMLGDFEIDVQISGIPSFPMINATLYATAFAPANATIDAQGQLVFTLSPTPRVAIDFVTPLAGMLDVQAFVTQMEATLQQFIPQIFNQVVRGIPIPTFDLSAIAGGFLPPGIVLGLGNAQTSYHPSYLMLEGDLVQVP
jgi:hypothetical protein